MLWGSGALVVGVVGLSWLAQALLWIPWLSLVWTVAMVRWTATLPGASLTMASYGLGALLVTYGVIFSLHWRQRLATGARAALDALQTGRILHAVGPTLAAALAVIALLLWRMALTQPDGRLHVHFLDIGQGDGILITTPSGRQALIDGGAEPERLLAELGAVMPFWDRSLDLLLLTHPDADHMAAQAQTPARFRVIHALETPVTQADGAADGWRDGMARGGAALTQQAAGGWVDLGDGVALWVLVVKLVYGDFSVLLTGDAGLPSESAWLRAGAPIASTVLKVGHHGSQSASGADFVAAVAPTLAVIQVGAENDYGHPHADVLANLAGISVLRTDRHGRVHLWSDGKQLWGKTEQGELEWKDRD